MAERLNRKPGRWGRRAKLNNLPKEWLGLSGGAPRSGGALCSFTFGLNRVFIDPAAIGWLWRGADHSDHGVAVASLFSLRVERYVQVDAVEECGDSAQNCARG